MATEDGTSAAGGEVGVTAPRRGDLFSPDCPTRRLLDRLGASLEVPLSALREWAERHMARIDDHRARADRSSASSR